MSFWDSLRPVTRAPSPTAVELTADRLGLQLQWNDGLRTSTPVRRLRQYCPCASCVEEWTGRRTFAVDTIPHDMTVTDVQPVGNYALAFTFGDGHNTGIFEWTYLRDLCTTDAPPARG